MRRFHKPLLLLLIIPLLALHFSWNDVVFRELFGAVNKSVSVKGIEPLGQSPPTSASATGDSTPPNNTHQCRGFYSKTQFDRSGSQIHGMLWHSLYAYQMNSTYCGVCGLSRHSHAHQRLLDTMGLSGVLPLWGEDCPDDAEFLDAGEYAKKILPNNQTVYSDVFANWRRKMTGIVQDHVLGGNGGSGGEGKPSSTCKIVAHVRRGDIDPSTSFRGFEKSKYLPNSYFIRLIEQYRRPGCQVFVHTEEAYGLGGGGKMAATIEGNNAFRTRNYTVIVGGKEEDAWRDFVDCDVFIASKSQFSYTPAFFSRGVVVFPGNYFTPMMPDWIVVPGMNETCITSSCFKREQEGLSLFNRPL